MTYLYNVELAKEDPCGDITSDYKPLPSAVTDFIAESMCGILEVPQPPRCFNWDFVPLPELVLFVKKVTTKAKIDVQTAIAALILVSRFKERLPKNVHGEYGTIHKIFLSALLVATKRFMGKSHDIEDYEEEDDDHHHHYSPDDTNSIEDSNLNYPSDFDPPILSTTPTSSISINSEDDGYSRINSKLADISGIYTLQEVNQMERGFLKMLGQNFWITEKDIHEFVEDNKYALGVC